MKKLSSYLGVLVIGGLLVARSSAAADTGSITGVVDGPERVQAIAAIDRQTGRRVDGRLDRSSGKFTIDSLPVGADYDCIVECTAARLEGVSLKVPPSDYEVEQPLSAEDIQTIEAKVRSMNKFEDVVQILALQGNIQHAAVLLNKLRTRPFYHSQPGEVVWRSELWHFERPQETWVKVQDELFVVLHRERIPRSVYDRKSITFDPALGGLRLTDQQSTINLGRIQLPAAEPGIRVRSSDSQPVSQPRRQKP